MEMHGSLACCDLIFKIHDQSLFQSTELAFVNGFGNVNTISRIATHNTVLEDKCPCILAVHLCVLVPKHLASELI